MLRNAILAYGIICLAVCGSGAFAYQDSPQNRQSSNKGVSLGAKLTTSNAGVTAFPATADFSHTTSRRFSHNKVGPAAIPASADARGLGPRPLLEAQNSIDNLAVDSALNEHPQVVANDFVTRSDKGDHEKLPFAPKVTPALAIAGIILVVAGTIYIVVGIKHRWIQIFLSAAFLTSLSVTVLLIYVVHPPVRDALQGAYLVAVFMSGMVVGAGSLAFTEVTGGLGCLLGGFCLSMWLLVLKPGSTLPSTGSKVILITTFTLAAYCLSFNRHTQTYGMIGCTSLAGATAFILGIDCFSRAGLKEFWLYIWDLNDDVFPLGTDTYPITRGMRVEIVMIIIIFLFGVLSQCKIWKIIKSQREKRDTTTLDAERQIDETEAAIAHHLEDGNEREKAEWERRYGDRKGSKRNDNTKWALNTDEGFRSASVGERAVKVASSVVENIPMRDLQASKVQSRPISIIEAPRNPTIGLLEQAYEGREASDLAYAPSSGHETIKRPNLVSTTAPDTSQVSPTIRFPHRKLLDSNSRKSSERSSIMTFAESKPQSPRATETTSRQSVSPGVPGERGEDGAGTEGKVAILSPYIHFDSASSIAATIDENIEESKYPLTPLSPAIDSRMHHGSIPLRDDYFSAVAPDGAADVTLGDVVPSPPALSVGEHDPEEFHRRSPADQDESQVHDSEGENRVGEMHRGKRKALAADSNNELLTKNALERGSELPNIALYRTSEWAKHISSAGDPFDDESRGTAEEASERCPAHCTEEPARLDFHGLRQSVTSSPATSSVPQVNRSARANTVPTEILPHFSNSSESFPGQIASQRSHWESSQNDNHHILAPRPRNVSAPVPHLWRSSTRGSQSLPLASRNLRFSSTPLSSQTLITSAIDENEAIDFAQTRRIDNWLTQGPDPTTMAPWNNRFHNKYSSLTMQTPWLHAGSTAQYNTSRTASKFSILDESDTRSVISRLSSAEGDDMPLSYRKALIQQHLPNLEPDPSVSSFDSHQPRQEPQASGQEAREALLAHWRDSMRSDQVVQTSPKEYVEVRRAEMILNRHAKKQSKQQQELAQQYRENMFDQAMRRDDMQDLHREAMRRMQASANRHV